jgi:hypothetical protein
MFLTNVSYNRHESPCMLLSQSGQSDRVVILGVGTGTVLFYAKLTAISWRPCALTPQHTNFSWRPRAYYHQRRHHISFRNDRIPHLLVYSANSFYALPR